MYMYWYTKPAESEVGSPVAGEDIQVGRVEGNQAVGEGSRDALEGMAAAVARVGWRDRLGSGVVGKLPGNRGGQGRGK